MMDTNQASDASHDREGRELSNRRGNECVLYDHGWVERARLKSCTWDSKFLNLEFEPIPTPGLISHREVFTIVGAWDVVSISDDEVSLLWVGTHVYFQEALIHRIVELAAAIPEGTSTGEHLQMMAKCFNQAQRESAGPSS